MSNCCPPVQTGQKEEARIAVESCCTPTIAGNRVADAAPTNLCPGCHQKGKKVDPPTCPLVYFSADGTQSFTKDQIRVPVHQKEPDDDIVPVCYCFHHSPATIRAEWLATGQSTVVEEIEAGIKAGQCACEIRNPQGSCCLGNVSAVVKRVTQSIRVPAQYAPDY